MEAVKKITINGKEYTVNMFDPVAAFEFFHDVTDAKLNGKSMAPLAKRALSQCMDPMMRSLDIADPNFTSWFSEHPEDMLVLENMAMEALAAPFAKKSQPIKKTAKS